MDILPLEIIVHIGLFADLHTTNQYRATCKTLLGLVERKHFILRYTHSLELDAISKRLSQIPAPISIAIQKPTQNLFNYITKLSKCLSKLPNLTALDVRQLTEESPHARGLFAHTPTSLERLDTWYASDFVSSLEKLTSFRAYQMLQQGEKTWQKLTALEELSLDQPPVRYDKHSSKFAHALLPCPHKLTRLHIATDYDRDQLFLKDFVNLKDVRITAKHRGLELVPINFSALESLSTNVRIDPDVIGKHTRLTRLEVSKDCFAEEFTLDSWTQLKHVRTLIMKEFQNKLARCSLNFISAMQIHSAVILDISRDDAMSLQYFKPQLLTALEVGINNTSMFKHNLTRLTRLESLKVRATTAHIVGVDTLTRLTRLEFYKAEPKGIQNLTGLQYLVLPDTRHTSDVAQLNLTTLHCTLERADATCLMALTSLEAMHLHVKDTFVKSMVHSLTNLTKLSIKCDSYLSVELLTGLTNLNELHLDTKTVDDFAMITALLHLTHLAVTCPLNTVEHLTVITTLESLYVRSTKDDSPELVKETLPRLISLKLDYRGESAPKPYYYF